MNAAVALYEASFEVPIFYIEDVYLTGIVAKKTKIKCTHHPLFIHYLAIDDCATRGLILQHEVTPIKIQILYDLILNFDHKCKLLEKNFSIKNVEIMQPKGCHRFHNTNTIISRNLWNFKIFFRYLLKLIF